jgi:ATP-binding cassette subfamily B protein/subfamily B ATP-binding cassette protein MsbA
MAPSRGRVLAYLKPYRGLFALAFIQVALISALEVLKPWPLKIVIDNVLQGQRLDWSATAGWSRDALLLGACGAMVLIYLILGVVAVVNNYTTIRIGQGMVNDLRHDLYAHLQRLSLAFHTRREVGDLMYRVTADTYAIQTLTMNGLFPILSALLLLVGMFTVMVRMDWMLTLLALSVCPALFLSIRILGGYIEAAATQARERESQVYTVVQRAMSAIRVIQAFTKEADEHRQFMRASRASLDAGLHLYTVQTAYAGLINVVIALGTALVVWVGARHVLSGALSVGEMVVFTAYLASLYGPINSILQTLGLIQGARAGVGRVFEILDVERDLKDGTRDVPTGGVRGEVRWEQVSFGYNPGQLVLKHLDLHVPAGQRVAVVGPTGAGKSTLLSLVPRLYDPQGGRVCIDGVDVREFRIEPLRRQVAMVLQPPLVFPTSVRDNIAYGRPGASRDEVVRAAQLARAHEFIMRLPRQYDTVVGEQGSTLSEGERQRLTIARAILRDAPILILDEPTSSVDAETEALIMEGLDRLAAGRTTFIIAHRLSTVRDADVIVVLRDGTIVERGPFAELIRGNGPFASLYRTQFELPAQESRTVSG